MPRFHLSFSYRGGRKTPSFGDQVVIADTLDQAVRQIARERGLSEVHIAKRYWLGKPANEAEIIEKDFEI